jgi:hypothetical protein
MQYWLKYAIITQKVGLFFNPFFFIDLAAWNPGVNNRSARFGASVIFLVSGADRNAQRPVSVGTVAYEFL